MGTDCLTAPSFSFLGEEFCRQMGTMVAQQSDRAQCHPTVHLKLVRAASFMWHMSYHDVSKCSFPWSLCAKCVAIS